MFTSPLKITFSSFRTEFLKSGHVFPSELGMVTNGQATSQESHAEEHQGPPLAPTEETWAACLQMARGMRRKSELSISSWS